MIRSSRQSARCEGRGEPLGTRSGSAIDYPALILPLADEIEYLPKRLVFRSHLIREIGAIEAGNENSRIAEMEVANDVRSYSGRGGGRQSHDGYVWQKRTQLRKLTIFRTKIMAPFGNAVRFVDRQRGHVPGAQIVLPIVKHQALRRRIKQAEFAPV